MVPKMDSPLGPLPEGWMLARLADLTTKIGSGATPSGGDAAYLTVRDKYALIRSQNVFDRRFDSKNLAFISSQDAHRLDGVEVQPKDILLNITGDGITFSRACMVDPTALPARVNQHVSIIRAKEGILDPGYLLSYLTHPKIKYYMESFNAGGSRRALTKAHIESFAIPLPPIEEQRAIARILGSLDDKIEANRRMNQTLEAMARAIFKSWFVDFDPVRAKAEGREPAGMDAETAAMFPDGFEEKEGRVVPEGWKIGIVDDLCLLIENGGTPKRMEPKYWHGGTIPWFKTGELTDGPLIGSEEAITEHGLSNSSCKLWPKNIILVALYASPTVGRLGILEAPGTANQACSALLAKPEYGYLFLFYRLLFSREELQNIAVGAAQQNISQQVVRHHEILIPSQETAFAFQQMIEINYSMRVNNEKQSRILAAIRDELLPRLLSGEKRIEV